MLTDDRFDICEHEKQDLIIAGLSTVAAENKWYYVMQLCLPMLAEVPEAMRDEIDDMDDSELAKFLAFGHRINEAIHLKLHGRAAIIEQLRETRRPMKQYNILGTDEWASVETLRNMLTEIGLQSRKLPAARRQNWAVKALFSKCEMLNNRMLHGADFQLGSRPNQPIDFDKQIMIRGRRFRL